MNVVMVRRCAVCCGFHLAWLNESGRDGIAANGGRLGAALPCRHTVSGRGVADGCVRGTALVQPFIAT